MPPFVAQTSLELLSAYRNVTRHSKRTAFLLVIIAGGVIAFLMSAGFFEWLLMSMRDGAIHSEFGHIQIVRPNYFQSGIANPYAYLLSDDPVTDAEIRKSRDVAEVTPRLAFSGLISFSDSTATFIGEGVDPAGDRLVNEYITIVDGKPLSADAPNGVIVGQGLAASIGVKVGDMIVLLGTTSKGAFSAVEVRVAGLFATFSKEYDDNALRAPISLVRKMTKVQGSTTWVVVLHDTENTEAALADLRSRLDPKHFELVPWTELADLYNKSRMLFMKQVLVVQILIALIGVLSVGNSLNAAIVERTSEIGTAMALGVRRMGVLRLFIMEGLVLGALGGSIGVTLGWILSILVSRIGIPMPPPPGMLTGFDAEILVTPALALEGFIVAVLVSLVSSFFPAWKASRLIIVDALRHQH